MKIKKLPRIEIDEKHWPYGWKDMLVREQKIGGVFLVFLSGKNHEEIEEKIKKIKAFCKTL